jgi:hypothetical protein
MIPQPALLQMMRPHSHVTLESLPAWTCSQGGEVDFETPEKETKFFQETWFLVETS